MRILTRPLEHHTIFVILHRRTRDADRRENLHFFQKHTSPSWEKNKGPVGGNVLGLIIFQRETAAHCLCLAETSGMPSRRWEQDNVLLRVETS